jgi:uncharacterized protein (TIRG00374 family)
MSKKVLLLLIQYVVFFGLGFTLIYLQYRKLTPSDMRDLQSALTQVKERSWIFIPIVFVGFLSHFFRGLRWRLMLESLDIHPTVTNITGAVFIGYITNLLIPRMGEVAKCTVMARYEKEPADKLIGTIVAERAFDMVCLLAICVLTFFVQMEVVSTYIKHLSEQMAGKNLPLLVGIALLGLVFGVAALVYLYRRNKDGKLGKFIKGLGEGVASILKLKQRTLFLLYTFLIWGAYLFLILLGFWALPATGSLGMGAALSVLVFGSLGMIVTPGGLGAYPQALQLVLSMLYAVPASFALAFGWISWLAQTLIILFFGALAFLILPVYNRKRNGQTAVDSK